MMPKDQGESIPSVNRTRWHIEQALNEVAKLPPSEQDALAAILLEELASEKKWSELFTQSQDVLAKLAEEALAHGALRVGRRQLHAHAQHVQRAARPERAAATDIGQGVTTVRTHRIYTSKIRGTSVFLM